MKDLVSLRQFLSGGAALLLVFCIFGEVIYAGCCSNYNWQNKYILLVPGRHGAYYQLCIGITIMGLFAFLLFIAYYILSFLELTFINDLVIKIIGLTGIVFWFGMFIAECCAIDWHGYHSRTHTRKALYKDKTAKYVAEHYSAKDFKYVRAEGDTGIDYAWITTYIINPKPFDKYTMEDEYLYITKMDTPCIIKNGETNEMCVGGWTKKKMQSYYDKSVKEMEKAKKEDEKLKKKTKKSQNSKGLSDIIKARFYDVEGNGPTGDYFGIYFAYVTSIFFAGQFIGIILFACCFVLEFISGGGLNLAKKKDPSSEAEKEPKNAET